MTDIQEARQKIVQQVLDATTLIEIEVATKALDSWLTANPEDVGMEDGYEQLSLMQNAMLAIEAATTKSATAA